MAKRYYWLKLQKDFFKRHDIRIIESMPNGKDYILFYLKMLVESVTHNGELRFSETIPYNEEMLAAVTNTNVDIVRSAMKVFIELGMIEKLDDETIYMAEVQRMIGSETDSAERVRIHRERQKALQCNNDVTKCNTEKEIDIEKDNISFTNVNDCWKPSKKDFQLAVDAWNNLDELGIKPISRMASDSQRYKMLGARLKQYGLDAYMVAIENIRQSDFLQGKKGSKPFFITFDWFVRPNNFVKVLDGNYNHDNRNTVPEKESPGGNNEWQG